MYLQYLKINNLYNNIIKLDYRSNIQNTRNNTKKKIYTLCVKNFMIKFILLILS